MEHIYENRATYGMEYAEDPGNRSTRSFRRVESDKEYFVDTGYQKGDPLPLDSLWTSRKIRGLIIETAKYSWSNCKAIAGELYFAVQSVPHIVASIRHFHLFEYIKANLREYHAEMLQVREVFRPIIYALRKAYENLDKPTKLYLICLSSVTVYLLWKSQTYIKHRKWNEINVRDKVVLITGANSGIGERLVYEFLERGAYVIMVSSDTTRTLEVVDSIRHYMAYTCGTAYYEYDKCRKRNHRARCVDYLFPVPHKQPVEPDYSKKLQFIEIDLGDTQSIWRGVYHIFEVFDHIDLIINNAAMRLPEGHLPVLTPDGLEAQFGVNYVGHFLMTNLIFSFMKLPLVRPCRVINVVCHEAFSGRRVKPEDAINAFKLGGIFKNSYAFSKFCQFLFHTELNKRLKGSELDVRTSACRPPACETNLRRYFPMTPFEEWVPGLTPDAGAQAILHCALSKSCENHTGLYYEHCALSPCPISHDRYSTVEFEKMCEQLWDATVEYTKPLMETYQRDDAPLPKSDVYGGAVFRDRDEKDDDNYETEEESQFDDSDSNDSSEPHESEPDKERRWQPDAVRSLIYFRNFYPHIFDRPMILQDWKKSMCEKRLIDIWTLVNGPLRFKPRRTDQQIEYRKEYFDPIYDRPPVLITTRNNWMY